MTTKQPSRKGPVTARLTIAPGQPMLITDLSDDSLPPPDPQRQGIARRIAIALKEYLIQGRTLVDGRYALAREFAPEHFVQPSRATVICCTNGILVRYEPADEIEVLAAGVEQTVEEFAPVISERVLHCRMEGDEWPSDVGNDAPRISVTHITAAGVETSIVECRPYFRCTIPLTPTIDPFGTPTRLAGVYRSIELQMQGVTLDGHSNAPERNFLTRHKLDLPVGWQVLEVYAAGETRKWRKSMAPAWAEREIQATVLQRKLREDQLRSLDPNIDARRQFARLLDEYKCLLDGEPKEEVLQTFLRDHPSLLSATQTLARPKVPLGARVTDFVLRDADGDYVLVELEKPSKRLFIKSGDTSSELTHACDQVSDWWRYLEDNLATVQRELDLPGISTQPRALVVIGRSSGLTEGARRKLTTLQNATPKLKIMTYDDVLANARAMGENILGPLWGAADGVEVYFWPPDAGPPAS